MTWTYEELGDDADRIRRHPEIKDVAAVRSPGGRLHVLVERQGMVYGPWARDIVIDETEGRLGDLAVVVVSEMPRDGSGHVDPAGCVALGSRIEANPSWVFAVEPPENEHEEAMAQLLSEMLPVRRVSMTDSLPVLGADSLVLVELTTAIQERFGIEPDVMDMFEADSVRELVRRVFSGQAKP